MSDFLFRGMPAAYARPDLSAVGESRPRRTSLAALIGSGALLALAVLAIFAIGAPATKAADAEDNCPNAAIRAQQGVGHLPDCRALEMVTPPSEGADVRFGAGFSTADGEMVCFNAENSVADAPLNGNTTYDDGYCAHRTASGWDVKWMTGPAPPDPRRGINGSAITFLSKDGKRVVFVSDVGIAPDWPGDIVNSPVWGTANTFLREAGATRWLSEAPPGQRVRDRPSGSDYGFAFPRRAFAASDDLKHGIFISSLRLLPEDTNDVVDVYEWTPDGLRVVSVDENGQAIGGTAPLSREAEQARAMPGAVSPDGSRVFFLAPSSGGTPPPGAPAGVLSVFMRENGETKLISPRLGPLGPAKNVFMEGAYANGSIVYMSTQQQLTDEEKTACETCSVIYRYDLEEDELSLFADHADGVAFLGASEDGETVVYRTASAAPQLIVRRNGTDTTLGPLSPVDSTGLFDAVAATRPDKRALRITPDGDVIVFASLAGFDGAPFMTRQVFRWTPEDGVEWISKRADGGPVTGFAAIGNYSTKFPGGLPRLSITDIYSQGASTGRVIADGGERVFFETQDPLVDEDVNGRLDVYQWHDGEVSLVTPGTQDEDAFYHDSSVDGKTVFFITGSRLIPELDRTSFTEMYASRVNGGYELPEAPQECKGDACRRPTAPPPGRPGVGSTAFDGDGNISRSSRTKLTIARLKTSVGPVVKLRIRVPEAGRISARGGGVRATGKRVAKGGVHGLRITLSPKRRRALRARGHLRIRVTITFRSVRGQTARRPMAVVFKQPKAKRPRRSR